MLYPVEKNKIYKTYLSIAFSQITIKENYQYAFIIIFMLLKMVTFYLLSNR